MFSRCLPLALLIPGVTTLSGVEGSRVVSSEDVYVQEAKAQEPIQPDRVRQGDRSQGVLTVGQEIIEERDGRIVVQVPVKNESGMEVRFEIRTAFYRTDGSMVEDPYPKKTGALEGLTKGFMGLVTMGAVELAGDPVSMDSTLQTRHTLKAEEELIVEHVLPWRDESVVGSRSMVELLPGNEELVHEAEVRRSMNEEFWKQRNDYFEARQEENERWKEERAKLEARRSTEEPLSEGYRVAMEAYWDAHREHQRKLESLEAAFESFEKDQDEMIEGELKRQPTLNSEG